MKRNRSASAVLMLVLMLVAGCARAKPQGPDKTPAPALGTPFCNSAITFRRDTANLNGQTFTTNPDDARRLLNVAADDLDTMVSSAPSAVLKDDITTVAAGFRAEAKALAGATPGNAKAALALANTYAQDKKVTAAAKDLDAWVHTNCGINTEGNPTTTIAGVTTTVTTTIGPAVPGATDTSVPNSTPSSTPGSTTSTGAGTGAPSTTGP